MSGTSNAETVATYTVAGKTYEIDHLGINYPKQWGLFAVYQDGRQITEFGLEAMALRPHQSYEYRTDDHKLDQALDQIGHRVERQAVAGFEIEALLQLLGDVFADQLRVTIRFHLAHFQFIPRHAPPDTL